jgi:hypothetical protein
MPEGDSHYEILMEDRILPQPYTIHDLEGFVKNKRQGLLLKEKQALSSRNALAEN